MRGTTLNALIQMLRRELKIAESPALGKNTREGHAYALRSAQDRLFTDNDWPFKIIDRDITLAAGQRYYAPPADLNLEDLRSANVLWSGQWTPLRRGITVQNYNVTNSDTGARLDPVRNWQIYNDPDNGDMLEFWPIPATDGGTARYRGVRKLSPLIADTDVCDLDDLLIVLQAAVDYVPAKEKQGQQGKADRRLFSLRRNLSDGRTFVSGGGTDPTTSGRYPHRIVITPAQSGG